jgi:hypothetical protein
LFKFGGQGPPLFQDRRHLGGIFLNVVQASRLFLFFLEEQARLLYHAL